MGNNNEIGFGNDENSFKNEKSELNIPEHEDESGQNGGSESDANGANHGGQNEVMANGLQQIGKSMQDTFLRNARSGAKPYDVPQIGE